MDNRFRRMKASVILRNYAAQERNISDGHAESSVLWNQRMETVRILHAENSTLRNQRMETVRMLRDVQIEMIGRHVLCEKDFTKEKEKDGQV